ncbi:MAG: HU family DNA-binding protein [Candidatus Nanoarchaeia archaeon]|jgi:DNA-binding protein HU-beta|nr:HU family DNA-binding protein [Candidatus Nanoarchaeia archaeon]
MNKGELIEAIAKKVALPKTQIDNVLKEVIDIIGKSVKKGEQVQLVGLGTFKRVNRKARAGVNPITGAKIKIPARKALKFTASAALKKL